MIARAWLVGMGLSVLSGVATASVSQVAKKKAIRRLVQVLGTLGGLSSLQAISAWRGQALAMTHSNRHARTALAELADERMPPPRRDKNAVRDTRGSPDDRDHGLPKWAKERRGDDSSGDVNRGKSERGWDDPDRGR